MKDSKIRRGQQRRKLLREWGRGGGIWSRGRQNRNEGGGCWDKQWVQLVTGRAEGEPQHGEARDLRVPESGDKQV